MSAPKLALAAKRPRPAPPSPLERLFAFQGEVLAARDRIALLHTALNHAGAVVPLGHAFWVDRRPRPRVVGASAQDSFERTTPFAQWLETTLRGWNAQHALDAPHTATLETRRSTDAFTYPFIHAHYTPFAPKTQAGGLLFTRDTPFTETETARLSRIAQLTGTQDAALRSKKRARLSGRKRLWVWGTVAALGGLSLVPVPLTALVPAEVAPREPFAVSAPIDGVVADVLVEPGQAVSEGDLLATLDDTQARNEVVLAEQALAVARGRERRAALSAFHDDAARRELAVAEAEAALAQARLDYARDRLAKTELRAPADGVALFARASELQGRPVATGESLLRLAEPTRVLLRIHAPLAHGESLREGARVRLFLDSDPLTPIEGKLTRADFEPTPQPDGHVAYEADATLDATPRIGARGVAKIYGGTAPLGYFVIRRPLTIARQWTGL